MSASVLIASATRYGSTQEVAEVVASTLRERGLAVDIQPMRKVRTLDQYRAVVLGAPLFMFHWHKDALSFLARHRAALTARPVAIFALGPTKSPTDEKKWQGSREQIEKELAQFPWLKPVALELFGGKFLGEAHLPPQSAAGPQEHASQRYTDWTAIRAWASNLAASLQPAVS